MMLDRKRMIGLHLEMLAQLGWMPPSGDVIDQIATGGLLTTAQAATICEVSGQTICRWNEDASRRGKPIGLKQVTWLLGTERLLDYVEKQDGLHARVKAESRLRQFWPIWSGPQELRPDMKRYEQS